MKDPRNRVKKSETSISFDLLSIVSIWSKLTVAWGSIWRGNIKHSSRISCGAWAKKKNLCLNPNKEIYRLVYRSIKYIYCKFSVSDEASKFRRRNHPKWNNLCLSCRCCPYATKLLSQGDILWSLPCCFPHCKISVMQESFVVVYAEFLLHRVVFFVLS